MYEGFATQLGESIRAARHRAGLSRAEVAQAVDLPVPLYCRLERGKLLPGVWVLTRLSATLGTPASALLRPATREELEAAEGALALPTALVRTLRSLSEEQLAALEEELRAWTSPPAS
jgi:transcriptional regulator with XRE-family HTH domain